MRHVVGFVPRRAAQKRRGTSLIEVLVSATILITATVILTQFALRSLDESALATRRAKAFLLAQDRMEEILAHRGDLDGFEIRARRDYVIDEEVTGVPLYHFTERPGDDYAAYRWRWQINPVEGNPALRDITVWAHWKQPRTADFRMNTQLRTYVAVPRGSGVAAATKEVAK